jgi:hypothetical protein
MAKKILETAKKSNLRIKVDLVDKQLKKQMPIWYHPALKQGEKHENNSRLSKHLCRKHKITTVGDAVELARLKDHNARKRDGTCPCNTCSNLEIHAGCNLLENCIRHANKLIERISPKWKPKLGLSIIPPREPTLHIPNGTIGTLPKKATIIRKRMKTLSVNNIFRILKGNEMSCDEELNEVMAAPSSTKKKKKSGWTYFAAYIIHHVTLRSRFGSVCFFLEIPMIMSAMEIKQHTLSAHIARD